MARLPEIEVLEARRRELVRRSDLYRATLVVECANIKARTARLRETFAYGQVAASWIARLAPVANLLLGRRRPALRSTVGKLALGWRLARGLTSLWRARPRETVSGSDTEPDTNRI